MSDFTRLLAVLPASDLARARTFYKDKLGFEPERVDDGGVIYEVAGSRFLLYETSYAGTAKNTALSLETADLDAMMTELRQRGVAFEEYDIPGLRTENGVAEMGSERGAWFTDSEDNIIAVVEQRDE